MSSTLIPVDESKANSRIETEVGAAQTVRYLVHELRQPLSALESLIYYLDILLAPGDVRARDQVEKIQGLVEQVNWIVDDAVHFAQACPASPARVALDDLVTQTLAERTRGVSLNVHLELAAGKCFASLDSKQARHLLASVFGVFRLIAVPATPVHVATECYGSRVGIRISCESATTAEELHEMFEPCHRKLPSGLGLSLASARNIVDANGGEMQVSADGDQGLVLTLTFPSAR